MQTDCDILLPKTLVLIGCGGHARSVADIYLKRFPTASLLFVDEKALPNEKIFGFPILATCPQEMTHCFLALGNNEKREFFWQQFYQSKCLHTIIAPSAIISSFATIGKNVFIGNLVHIGPEAKIDHNTIINTGAVIEHEVSIGKHSHIAPNAVVSGRCSIGDFVFVGVGAVVKDSIYIGSNIIIGAGAVVVKDLLEPGIYVGCPAQLLQNKERLVPILKDTNPNF